jgi:hypothetical protein
LFPVSKTAIEDVKQNRFPTSCRNYPGIHRKFFKARSLFCLYRDFIPLHQPKGKTMKIVSKSSLLYASLLAAYLASPFSQIPIRAQEAEPPKSSLEERAEPLPGRILGQELIPTGANPHSLDAAVLRNIATHARDIEYQTTDRTTGYHSIAIKFWAGPNLENTYIQLIDAEGFIWAARKAQKVGGFYGSAFTLEEGQKPANAPEGSTKTLTWGTPVYTVLATQSPEGGTVRQPAQVARYITRDAGRDFYDSTNESLGEPIAVTKNQMSKPEPLVPPVILSSEVYRPGNENSITTQSRASPSTPRFRITFSGQPGITYRVQSRANLHEPWSLENLPAITATQYDAQSLAADIPLSSPARFYRIAGDRK